MPRCLALLPLLFNYALAQTAPAFEVASVKPAAPCCAGSQDHVEYPVPKVGEDRIDFRYVTLRYCILFAFRVEDYRISGPAWLGDAHFDIEAKGPAGTHRAQLPEMMQSLLAERFGLRIHRETKAISTLGLVVNGGGPKLKESDVKDEAGPTFGISMSYTGAGKMEVRRASMTQFAEYLSSFLHRPVVDLTGLKGRYDLDAAVSNEDSRGTTIVTLDGMPQTSDSASSIFTSIKDFGLKLQSRKAPMEVIVVDHAEKTPSGN